MLGINGEKISSTSSHSHPLLAHPGKVRTQANKRIPDAKPEAGPQEPDSPSAFPMVSLPALEGKKRSMHRKQSVGSLSNNGTHRFRILEEQETINDFEPRYRYWKERPDDLRDVLRMGRTQAKEEAAMTLEVVRQLIGISY